MCCIVSCELQSVQEGPYTDMTVQFSSSATIKSLTDGSQHGNTSMLSLSFTPLLHGCQISIGSKAKRVKSIGKRSRSSRKAPCEGRFIGLPSVEGVEAGGGTPGGGSGEGGGAREEGEEGKLVHVVMSWT